MMTRRRLLGMLTLALSGCAKPDWIESTLVTVDVSGHWVGNTRNGGTIELRLQHAGPKVTGHASFSGQAAGRFPPSAFEVP